MNTSTAATMRKSPVGVSRMKGCLEIGPAYEDRLVRIELFGDGGGVRYDPTTGEILRVLMEYLPCQTLCDTRPAGLRNQRPAFGLRDVDVLNAEGKLRGSAAGATPASMTWRCWARWVTAMG